MTEIDIGKYRSKRGRDDMQRKSIVLTKPKEVGSFSLDGARKFSNGRSQLSFLEDSSNLSKNMDLNDGYKQRFVKRDDNIKERLDNLLRWFISNLHKFHQGDDTDVKSLGKFPHFILWRGHMTKIMCTPYENQDGWTMAAQKFGSTIYVSEIETVDAKRQRLNQTEKQNLMMYWGVRFEKYMTRSHCVDRTQPKISRLAPVAQNTVTVNTNEAFCTVMRTKLNAHDIIHSAEVDCCLQTGSSLDPPDNYVELKTSREFSSRKQEDNFHRYKTKKWWAQSFLAGVPQITCGFRDDNGVVVRIHDYKTLDLPRMAARVPGGGWDANVSLLFLDELFTEVKNAFVKSGDKSIMIFSWNQGDDKISIERFDANSEHGFLPEWYLSSLRHMNFAS